MSFSVRYDEKALKQLKKMDRSVQRLIVNWIEKNLIDTENPRLHGKGLSGDKSGYWRYRVGDYRVIADIRDEEIIIVIVEIGHRRDFYR